MARSGRRYKTKFVLCKELIILVVVLVAMVITTICLSLPTKAEKKLAEFNDEINAYNEENGASIALLEEDHVFKKVNLDEVENLIENSGDESVFILYGSLSNSTLLSYLSTINTEAKQREIETVYLYSSSKVEKQEDQEDSDFLAEIERDEKVFKANDQKVDLLTVPALYVYKNKTLIFSSINVDEDGSYNWNIMLNKAFSL